MADPIALPGRRFPRQTLHHVRPSKLNRVAALASHGQLHLWVRLEAHAEVAR